MGAALRVPAASSIRRTEEVSVAAGPLAACRFLALPSVEIVITHTSDPARPADRAGLPTPTARSRAGEFEFGDHAAVVPSSRPLMANRRRTAGGCNPDPSACGRNVPTWNFPLVVSVQKSSVRPIATPPGNHDGLQALAVPWPRVDIAAAGRDSPKDATSAARVYSKTFGQPGQERGAWARRAGREPRWSTISFNIITINSFITSPGKRGGPGRRSGKPPRATTVKRIHLELGGKPRR